MQWNHESFAGFSDRSSWIKVNPNYTYLNVADLELVEGSLLNTYKKLISLRNSQLALQYGEYKKLSINNNCISFTRTYQGNQITCYFNFSEVPLEISLGSKEDILLGSVPIGPDDYLIVKMDQ